MASNSGAPGKIAKTLGAIFALAALGGGVYAMENTIAPASAGITYLENHGFTQVTPTGHPFFTGCAKGTQPRSYEATNKKDGKREKETLCFGTFHKIYKPWQI